MERDLRFARIRGVEWGNRTGGYVLEVPIQQPQGCSWAPLLHHNCTLLSVPCCLPVLASVLAPSFLSPRPSLPCSSIYNWFSDSLRYHRIELSQFPSLSMHLSNPSAVGPSSPTITAFPFSGLQLIHLPAVLLVLALPCHCIQGQVLSGCTQGEERMRCPPPRPGHREDNDLSASFPGHDEKQ